MELTKIESIVSEMYADFEAIAMPRSAYVLEHLVVKPHEHITQQWLQCVLEMRIKYNNIRRGILQKKIIECEIQELLETGEEIEALKAEQKRIDLDELHYSQLGMMREFFALYEIYKQFPHFTREEIEAGQAEYWYNRLTKQAAQDIEAMGRVSVGNIEALRQIGLKALPDG